MAKETTAQGGVSGQLGPGTLGFRSVTLFRIPVYTGEILTLKALASYCVGCLEFHWCFRLIEEKKKEDVTPQALSELLM